MTIKEFREWFDAEIKEKNLSEDTKIWYMDFHGEKRVTMHYEPALGLEVYS